MVLRERDCRMLVWSNVYGFIDAYQAATWRGVGDRVTSHRLDWMSEEDCLQRKRFGVWPCPRLAISWTLAFAILPECSTS